MKFHYDKQEDALSIRFIDRPYAESEEIREGIIFDYDDKGRIIAIEILDAREQLSQQFREQLEKKLLPLEVAIETE